MPHRQMRSGSRRVRGGVGLQPAYGGPHVLDVGGERDLRREPVLDRRHRESVAREVAPEVRTGGPRSAGPAAAVQKDDHRYGPPNRLRLARYRSSRRSTPPRTHRSASRISTAGALERADRRHSRAAPRAASSVRRATGAQMKSSGSRLERQRAAKFRGDLAADRERRRSPARARAAPHDPTATAAAALGPHRILRRQRQLRRVHVERISVRAAAAHLQRSEHVGGAAGERATARPSASPRPACGAPPRPSPPRPRLPIITKKFSKMPGVRNAAKRLYC